MHPGLKRTVLGACALGLALLIGCVANPSDPPSNPPPMEPLPEPDPPPPPEEPPPEEPPPLPPLPPRPPAPEATNAPGDEYDAAGHRVLVADCPSSTLLSMDADTGQRSVLIDTWPWSEPDSTSCVRDLVVARDGQSAYATVERTFERDGDTCSSDDFVSIDTATGAVTPIYNIDTLCCDDCGSHQGIYSKQIDAFHERVLYLTQDCEPDWCDHTLAATPFSGEPRQDLYALYPPPCYPDEDCTVPDINPVRLAFDPMDPDHHALVVIRSASAEHARYIDVTDIATGEIVETIPIQTTWGDLSATDIADISVDAEYLRVFVTLFYEGWPYPDGEKLVIVVGIDRYTGDQILIYDGRPAPDGSMPACRPDASFDSSNGRLLLIEPPGGISCQDQTFALDVLTGAFTRL
jgi:hypothetical protein